MKTLFLIMALTLFFHSGYAKDFNKTEYIINNILSQQPEEEKAEKKQVEKKKIQAKETDKTREKEDGRKVAGMTSPDEVLLKTGIQLYDSNLPDQAADKFKALVTGYPKSQYLDSARVWLARIYIKEYRYNDAINELTAVPEDSGEYPLALYNTGYCYMLKGDDIKSVEFFQLMSARFPEHQLADNAILYSGKIFLRNRKGNQALESAIRLVKQYGDRETADDAYYLLGKIFEKDPLLKDPESARRIYSRFLKKAESGEPVFVNSPLKARVGKDLKYIEKNYFRFDN